MDPTDKDNLVGKMSEPTVKLVKRRHRVSGKWLLLLIAIVVIGGGLSGYFLYRAHNKKQAITKTPVSPYPPTQSPDAGKDDNFVNKNKQALNQDSDEQALLGRIKLANYYFNTYKIDKLLEELAQIKKEYPAAEQYQEYLVSLYDAYVYKDDQTNMVVVAKKIVQLEKAGKSYDQLVPGAEKRAIEEAAKK